MLSFEGGKKERGLFIRVTISPVTDLVKVYGLVPTRMSPFKGFEQSFVIYTVMSWTVWGL